jgi:hypothetical protein
MSEQRDRILRVQYLGVDSEALLRDIQGLLEDGAAR